MHALYPIPKRQRRLGAFPTADAMRAAKAASTSANSSASVTLDPTLPATTLVEKPVKDSTPKKVHGDAAKI